MVVEVTETCGRHDIHRATSVWHVAWGRLLDLGRGESGAALVITLAMFSLMYLACCGVFAVSTAVKERIQLQNAADAAVYSAAVVQADTLSRIATLNRAMAWTYADMTRLQMDYIVRRWLGHTCDHYGEDYNGRGEVESLKDYNKNSIPYKLGLGLVFRTSNGAGPCKMHSGLGGGYYIGSDGNFNTMLKVHLNGRSPLKYRIPKGVSSQKLPSINSVGHDVFAAEVRARIVQADIEYMSSSGSNFSLSDITRLYIELGKDVEYIGKLTQELLQRENVSWQTRRVLADNLVETVSVFRQWDAAGKRASLDMGIPLMMKTQIAMNKITIATMNVLERKLALEMPEKIERCVHDVLDANLSTALSAANNESTVQYLIDQHRVLGNELTLSMGTSVVESLLHNADVGYLKGLRNTSVDENRFLAFADLNTYDKEFKTGINQWFVRGNGVERTNSDYGLQRSYKHWPEGPFAKFHAMHSPLMPSCWNTERLEGVEKSVALFSEWQWWSDTWFCFDIYLVVPPGRITIHVNAPHFDQKFRLKKLFPSRAECPHKKKPGLLGLESGKIATSNWADLFKWLKGAAEDACVKRYRLSPPRFKSHDYTPVLNFGLNFLASLDDLLGTYEPIEKYQDGCTIYPDLLGGIPRASTFKFTGYSRLYADDPDLYTGTYVGMKALPLVMDLNYFGKAGTISVGIRRQNGNVFARIVGMIDGFLRAFDPDWNGAGTATHTYVFASAKAGYKNKGDPLETADYRIDWRPNDQGWNLCQSDWDAVFVPVRMAKAMAAMGHWLLDDENVLENWVSDDGAWRTLDGGRGDVKGWNAISAPSGVRHAGTLDWRGVSHVLYH